MNLTILQGNEIIFFFTLVLMVEMKSKIILSPIGERLEEARLHFEATNKQSLSWNKLSSKIGKTASAPTNWKKGKISNEVLKELAVALQVNFNWLLDGSGSMQLEPKSVVFDTQLATNIGQTYIQYIQTQKKSQVLVKKLNDLMAKPSLSHTNDYFKDLKDYQNLINQNNELLQSIHEKLTSLTENII